MVHTVTVILTDFKTQHTTAMKTALSEKKQRSSQHERKLQLKLSQFLTNVARKPSKLGLTKTRRQYHHGINVPMY